MMPEDVRLQIHEACVFDMCATDGDISMALCEIAQDIADRCQDDYTVTVTDWRGDTFCSKWHDFSV